MKERYFPHCLIACLVFLILFAGMSSSFADDMYGEGWFNYEPPDVPGTVDAGSGQSGTTTNLVSAASSDSISANTAYSGPSPTSITPELQVLAAGLDNDPVKIFNYVHNKIEYQAYYGSAKGAHLTYVDGGGNDMDQASLLIALLTQAGYTANYLYGQYSVPDTSADGYNLSNWLGVSSSLTQIALAAGGIPVGVGTSHGTYIVWPFTHVWVQVTVGGTVYQLDPSYKQYQAFSGINYATASGYSRTQLLTDAVGTSTSDYAQNLSRTSIESRLGQYAKSLHDYITDAVRVLRFPPVNR